MKEQIKQIVKSILPRKEIDSSQSLVDDGVIDSLAIVSIISELSIAFDIIVPFEEITPKNFNSLDAMVELVERLKNK